MMAIRKASEVAAEVHAAEDFIAGPLGGACLVTADRLAIVARLREYARVTPMPGEEHIRLVDAADLLESEIKAAAASKGTNDDG